MVEWMIYRDAPWLPKQKLTNWFHFISTTKSGKGGGAQRAIFNNLCSNWTPAIAKIVVWRIKKLFKVFKICKINNSKLCRKIVQNENLTINHAKNLCANSKPTKEDFFYQEDFFHHYVHLNHELCKNLNWITSCLTNIWLPN